MLILPNPFHSELANFGTDQGIDNSNARLGQQTPEHASVQEALVICSQHNRNCPYGIAKRCSTMFLLGKAQRLKI